MNGRYEFARNNPLVHENQVIVEDEEEYFENISL